MDSETPAALRLTALAARRASRALQALPSSERAAILLRLADGLVANEAAILAANAADVAAAEAACVAPALLARLQLSSAKLAQLAAGARAIAALPEPLGRPLSRLQVAQGLELTKVAAPLGVLLVVFEARPDALPQIASLAIRAGDGLLLKGGKEASRSCAALHAVVAAAVAGAPGMAEAPGLVAMVTSRGAIDDLLQLDDVIDLVIPRGSNALVSHIKANTRIPVLGHADGVCHVFVDAASDAAMAARVVVDSKVDYPAACNAMETLLLHEALVGDGRAEALLEALRAKGVALLGGPVAAAALGLPPAADLHAEYSALTACVEIVRDTAAAVAHIHSHGSGHTECIVTADPAAADLFLTTVDAACVFHNASTRFADGFRFGLGAEVGVATGRLHARGPVGLEGLLTSRWLLRGEGQVVAKDTGVTYTHVPLPV